MGQIYIKNKTPKAIQIASRTGELLGIIPSNKKPKDSYGYFSADDFPIQIYPDEYFEVIKLVNEGSQYIATVKYKERIVRVPRVCENSFTIINDKLHLHTGDVEWAIKHKKVKELLEKAKKNG